MGVGALTSAGSLCRLQHPLGRLRNVGHNAVPEFGWLFGDCPWNCPRVLDDRGAPPFFPTTFEEQREPLTVTSDPPTVPRNVYILQVWKGGGAVVPEKSHTARRGSINNSRKFYFSPGDIKTHTHDTKAPPPILAAGCDQLRVPVLPANSLHIPKPSANIKFYC